MGILAQKLKEKIKENNLKQSDFERLTKGTVTQSTISSIYRGSIPYKLALIDAIARALKESTTTFRGYALQDSIEKECERYGINLTSVFEQIAPGQNTFKLPLYEINTLHKSISSNGAPEKKPISFFKTSIKYNPGSYAVIIANQLLAPRVLQNEIAVFSPQIDNKRAEEYGLVKTRNNLHIGRILEHQNYIIVETNSPYGINHIEKKDIKFVHHIVAIHHPSCQQP